MTLMKIHVLFFFRFLKIIFFHLESGKKKTYKSIYEFLRTYERENLFKEYERICKPTQKKVDVICNMK